MDVKVNYNTLFKFYCRLSFNIFRSNNEDEIKVLKKLEKELQPKVFERMERDIQLRVLKKLEKDIKQKLPLPVFATNQTIIKFSIDDDDLVHIRKYIGEQLTRLNNLKVSESEFVQRQLLYETRLETAIDEEIQVLENILSIISQN
ncbi:MAG: hypothetical protein BWY74_00046 [Firmicutes bacterium ADurb.Bin419]|nr:MAG: hypothetical protein BWY74_00046 [Firmicutes bacterium ADurb.Bin419]